MKVFEEASRRTTHPATRNHRGLSLSYPESAGCFSYSSQTLNARSSARPSHRVNYRSDIIDGRQSMGLRKPKSIKHNGKSLAETLEAHERFFSGKDGGVRADPTGAELSHAAL